ncbi:MAG: LacI family DNA-binding transcriptional regulator [Chthoniobacteraceae bacterium]
MRKVSMLDVARAAGVSKNAVSLALRNDPQIPPQTRKRIAEIAKRLGYTRNPVVSHLMAQLRTGATAGHKATLALINANKDREAFRQHPTIPSYVAGCRRAASRQGYSLDEFWLHDPELDGARLVRILQTRNIRGAVIAGLMNNNRLPERFQALWETFPCVVTGVRTRNPALSFCSTDHHILARRAFEKALQLGYKRPALVLDAVIDELVEGRFTAGVLVAQQSLPRKQRVSPFYSVTEAKANPAIFHRWLEKEKPDVILTLYHTVRQWVQDAGFAVPDEVGLIQLEWRKDHEDWAGMHQHNEEVGEAAVEMVIGMLHNNERGVPQFPRATLVGSTWMNGSSVRMMHLVTKGAD